VYTYSKLFNHLSQYATEQVDTDKKKKYHFMNVLSSKLQERLALHTGMIFLELASWPSSSISMERLWDLHEEGCLHMSWEACIPEDRCAPSLLAGEVISVAAFHEWA
jgi:hypothetical protein